MRLIDADEVIKTIDYSNDMGGSLGKVVECVKFYAKFMVQSSPTVEERKTGKWIYIRDEEGGNGLYECPICHRGDIHAPEAKVNFCWNCGAKMEE